MNILQLSFYDIRRIFQSIWTYIGFLLILIPICLFLFGNIAHNTKLNSINILAQISSFLIILGVFCLVKTICRDFSEETIQLFLNKSINRKKYFLGKLLSILLISIVFIILTFIFTSISQLAIGKNSLSLKSIIFFILMYILLYFSIGLFLYTINILVQKTSLIYTLAIIILVVSPFVYQLSPFIPNYGEFIKKTNDMIPFVFLLNKIYMGRLSLNFLQSSISILFIIILTLLNISLSKKRMFNVF
ncbi:ABC transporter permease [Staphylococcus capitis]|uniref:ABC transporter permease n=1 Tax=Staphylococcus capitis TaxID=29388 RepID=UPI00066CDC31|nr:ABC transporter permease subunit [Staphylococcus capitis]MDH8926001.1 ABC transporter permease subunit [Staphylococcus capitis]MDS3984242.1 ABC transporter permease subunit [Staphylococcus capitis]